MINYLIDIITNIDGSLLQIGIDNTEISNTIKLNKKIKKNTSINKYKKNIINNNFDYIVCNYEAISNNLKSFIKFAIKNSKHKVYIYGQNIKLISLQASINNNEFTYLIKNNDGSILIIDIQKYYKQKPSIFKTIMEFLNSILYGGA